MSSKSNPIDERQAALREDALRVATSHLAEGNGVAESIELAIDYLYSRTYVWNGEEEMREWLKSRLNPRAADASSKTMKSAPSDKESAKFASTKKNLLIACCFGLILGLILGFFLAPRLHQSDEFTVQILNAATAFKINKRTGQTWKFNRVTDKWEPIQSTADMQR